MHDWLTWNSTKDGKPRPEPLFCKRCGSKLEPDNEIVGYDEYTGKPIQPFLSRKRCSSGACRLDQW